MLSDLALSLIIIQVIYMMQRVQNCVWASCVASRGHAAWRPCSVTTTTYMPASVQTIYTKYRVYMLVNNTGCVPRKDRLSITQIYIENNRVVVRQAEISVQSLQ